MNKMDLVRFGEFIARAAFRKEAQWGPFARNSSWNQLLGAGIGGTMGFLGGGAAGKAYDPNSSGIMPAAIGGVLGAAGGMAMGSHPRADYNFYKNTGNWLLPTAGVAMGAYGGYKAGENLPTAGSNPWIPAATSVMGGIGGGFLGHALNKNRLQASVNSMRGLLGENSDEIANQIHSGLNSHMGGELAKNDPNKLLAGVLAQKHLGELSGDQLHTLTGRMDLLGRKGEAIGKRTIENLGFDAASPYMTGHQDLGNLANQLGVQLPSQMTATNRFLHNQLGQNWRQDYLNPALMLGGGYMGLQAAGNVYNTWTGNNNKDRNGRVIVV